jgi:hypothetical protein
MASAANGESELCRNPHAASTGAVRKKFRHLAIAVDFFDCGRANPFETAGR